MAKSALNQQAMTIADELRATGSEIIMLALDPGDLPTRLSRGNRKTDIDKSVRGMVEFIEKVTLEDSDSFLEWSGRKIPI